MDVYQKTLEPLAVLVNKVAAFIPPRRERMLHIGLFGYSRGVGKVSLPRAITFTGSFYSLGVPPEFIGTGRALRIAQKKGYLPFIKRLYVNLERDLVHAGKYLNKENLALLAKEYPAFKDVMEDIREIEKMFGIELGPLKDYHFLHRNFSSNIYHKMKMGENPSEDVVSAAKIRKSLG
jgi:phosphoenolpyruvate carboxylase